MLLRERLAAMPEEQRLNTLETLPSFLADVGQTERLQTILTTFDFLNAKVDAIGVEQLISDYEFTTAAEAKLIQAAMRLSAHVLVGDTEQLPGQLIGRLLIYRQPVIRALLDQARAWHDKPWLQPRLPGLTPPGGPLWHILRGHSGEVDGLAIAGGKVVSGSEDKTVRVWDLESGQEVTKWEGEAGILTCDTIFLDKISSLVIVAGDRGGYVHGLQLMGDRETATHAPK